MPAGPGPAAGVEIRGSKVLVALRLIPAAIDVPCPMCMHLLAFTVPCRVPVTGSLARSNSHVEIAVLGVGGSHRVNSHAQGDTINKFTYD